MKHLKILILLLIAGTTAFAQTGMTNKKQGIAFNPAPVEFKPAATISAGSDTLEIHEPLQIHFIKIGDQVYQLVTHPITIEKAPQYHWGTSIFPSTLDRLNLLSSPN